MRLLNYTLLVVIASTIAAFAETYEFRAGPCQSIVRYSHLSGNVKRQMIESSGDCFRKQIHNRQQVGGRFITGGAASISEYIINLTGSGYEFTNGRPDPADIEASLRGMAFGLLELAVQQKYKMDDGAVMDDHLTSIRNLVGRQIDTNYARATAALAFAESMNSQTQTNIQDVATRTSAAAVASGERRDTLMSQISALPAPIADPLKPRPVIPNNGENVGPILSHITGEGSSPSWEISTGIANDDMRRLPPTPAKRLGLEALAYALQEHEANPELAKELFEYAQAQRFVAEGRLPAALAKPDPIVRDYTDYRRKSAVFDSKAASLDALLPSLEEGSPEAERALNSQSAATEVAALASEALRIGDSFAEASDLIEIGTQILDIGLGFVPLVSSGKDLYEVVFGINPITNEKLDTTDRVLATVGLLSGGIINTKATRLIAKGIKRLGGTNTLAHVNAVIAGGDDIMRQAVRMGFNKPKVVKDFFVRPIGEVWGRVRAGLTFIDGDARKVFQAAPPSIDMLPKNGVYARYMKREYAEGFRNGTGSLGPLKDEVTLITSYDDVREFKTHESLSRRLWLRNKTDTSFIDTKAGDWVLVRFKMKGSVWDTLSTPTAPNGLKDVPGWMPGGRTQGGASEFLISNGTADKLDIIIDRNSIIIDDIFVD